MPEKSEFDKFLDKVKTLGEEDLQANINAEIKVLNGHNLAAVECRSRLTVLRDAYHKTILKK